MNYQITEGDELKNVNKEAIADRQKAFDKIKSEIFWSEEGVTTEAEFLRAVIFIAKNRLKVIGKDKP
jgi:hypothetical protein